MESIQVELKFSLKNKENLVKKLKSIAEIIVENEHQKDIYYIPPHRDFLREKPIRGWLRLRLTNNDASIDYKHWLYGDDGKAYACNRIESKIDHSENVEKLLEMLNFSKVVVVDKNRMVWKYKMAELAIDTIKGLGDYLEIEAKGNFPSSDRAIEYLYDIAGELNENLGEQDFHGYPYRLLEKQGVQLQ